MMIEKVLQIAIPNFSIILLSTDEPEFTHDVYSTPETRISDRMKPTIMQRYHQFQQELSLRKSYNRIDNSTLIGSYDATPCIR